MATLTESRQFDLADHQFTVDEAAQHLRISKSFFYELVAQGKLRTVKIGGKKTVVQGAEVRRFMKALAAQA